MTSDRHAPLKAEVVRQAAEKLKEHAELGEWDLSTSEAADLIKQVAELYPTEARRLDHVIWRHVSGRDVFKEDDVEIPDRSCGR